MATLVVTLIGDDQSGLVDAVAGVVADHGGNWEKSQMSHLAGKFAGIVLITVPDQNADALVADLEPLEATGLLDLTIERTTDLAASADVPRLRLDVVGVDRPGIVREITHAIAARGISIEELETEVVSAPMAGGRLFKATALLNAPAGSFVDELRVSLDDLARELSVDIDLTHDAN